MKLRAATQQRTTQLETQQVSSKLNAISSFKAVQEMLLFCLEEEIIDDEEFPILYEEYTPQNLPFPHFQYETFPLLKKDPAECKADFRVEKAHCSLML